MIKQNKMYFNLENRLIDKNEDEYHLIKKNKIIDQTTTQLNTTINEHTYDVEQD